MKKNSTYKLVVAAMLVAIATVLNQFAVLQLPYGGGVTIFSQVPIIAISWIFGPAWGLISGFVMSLFQLLFGLSNLSYVKGISSYLIVILCDYILPYTLLGLGGIFKDKLRSNYLSLSLGTVLVCVLRLLCHFISGVTVWADYTNGNNFGAVALFSLTYNGGYMLPETIITIIGVSALYKFLFPRLDKNGAIK